MRRNNTNHGDNFANNRGPLLTNHLRDLDMELELLKRKRELFEQKQDILNIIANSEKRQFDNKQPFYTYNQPNASPLLNVNPDSGSYRFSSSYNPRSQGMKRQSIRPWQNQDSPPPKRFNDQHKINPWLASEPKPAYRPVQNFNLPQTQIFPGPIKALMDLKVSIGQRTKKFVPQPRKNFNPTKVTKPKNKNVVREQIKKNNGNTKLVEQTPKPVAKEPAPQAKKNFQDNILHAHKPPSVQMKGRLELALGTIVKCVKELCTDPTTLEYFMIPFIQRVIKHTIRTRIRDVMMNEPVESVSVIVDKYRQKYPQETDVELMKVAEDAHKFNTKNQNVLHLIEADEPEEFFKKNISKLLSDKLDEAFYELKNVYKNKTFDFDKCVESFPKESDFSNDVQIQEEHEVVIADAQCSVKSEKGNNTSTGIFSTDVKTINEQLQLKSANTKKYVEFMDKIIENRLPKILPRYKDMIMSILCIDKEFLSVKAFVANDIKHKLRKAIEAEDKIITIDDELDIREKAAEPSAESASGVAYSTCNKGEPEQEVAITETPEVSASTSNMKPSETTEENVSSEVTTEVATIVTAPIVPTPDQAPVEPVSPKTVLNQTVPATAKDAEQIIPSIPKTPASKGIQYIKLIGRPKLPSRQDIYDFLNAYKPNSIKKHKTINNLLVVGFSDKEAFENILQANETIIGDATIIIKASEQINTTPVQNKANEQGKEIAVQKTDDETVNEQEPNINESETVKDLKTTVDEIPDASEKLNTSDEIIPSDLDTQITDLLTSIRQANEEDGTSKISSDEQMDATDTKEETQNGVKENDDKGDEDDVKEISEKVGDEDDDVIEIPGKVGDEDDDVIEIPGEVGDEDDDVKEIPGKLSDTELSATDSQDSKPGKDLETIMEIDDDDDGASGQPKPRVVEEVAKAVKESGRATPTRSSSRLATITPSTIKTRRASRLASNN